MRYTPLANLKNTTGIVNFCKEANEIVVANRNGLPKLILMSREVYKNGLGKVTKDVYFNVKRDMELVAEPILIRTFNIGYVCVYGNSGKHHKIVQRI